MNDGMISDGLTFVYSSLVTPPIDTGTVERVGGKEYRFVQNAATALTAGYPCVYMATNPDAADWDVTATLDQGVAEGAFAGLALAAVGAYEYTWILKDGLYHTCTLLGAVTAGNGVIVDADGASDGGFETAVDTGLLPLAGVAFESVTGAATGVSVWVKDL